MAIALLVGYLIAAMTTDSRGASFVETTSMREAPPALFLWTKTFPIGLYTPALLPVLVGSLVSTVETYGATTATFMHSFPTAEGALPHMGVRDRAGVRAMPP